MIRGAFTPHLNQHCAVLNISAAVIQTLKHRIQLNPVTVWIDIDLDLLCFLVVGFRCLINFAQRALIESVQRQELHIAIESARRFELKISNLITRRIKREIAGKCQHSANLWRCDKRMSQRIAVVAFRKVAIERGDNGVCSRGVIKRRLFALPLSDTWSTAVAQHDGADRFEHMLDAVSLHGRSDLLRARRHIQRTLCGQPSLFSLLHVKRNTAQILVA
mmetsp:Transcript_16980/g.27074  ORF Transcript_16980/g.27074 Transcript_16980/m.27074 type:complete len:219 (+) Transcript_16980:667-1323(+)